MPDTVHEIRLGTVFIRNFYIGLDYSEKNEIMIGVNAGASERARSHILGAKKDPYASTGLSVGAVIIILGVLFVIALVLYIKTRND